MSDKAKKSMLRKNIWRLALLTLSAALIYTLPYFRSSYYDIYLDTFGLTNIQMGSLGSIFGVIGVVTYLFGGVLADRFPARKLVSIALILTGLGGFAHLLTPSYGLLLVIYGFWGVTSLLIFWPALVKSIRLLAGKDEQGRAFGLFEGGRGVVSATDMVIVLAIFGFVSKRMTEGSGLYAIITYYSVVLVLMGVIAYFFLPTGEVKEENTFKWSHVPKILKMPVIWLLTLICASGYAVGMSLYYFPAYATQVFGTTTMIGATIPILARYCKPVVAPLAGLAADKIGRARVNLLTFFAMILGIVFIISIPGRPSFTSLLMVGCVLICCALYMHYGAYWSLMEDGGVPMEVSGTAIGVICTIGYLPEVFCPLIAGKLLDSYAADVAYRYYFVGIISLLVVGCATILVFMRKYKKTPVEPLKQQPAVEGQQ